MSLELKISPYELLMYYMFKYLFGITTTLLESLRRQNTQFGARFRHTNYKDLVFERVEFLSVVGAQNESLRIILMYYIFKYLFGITTTLLESLRSQNNSGLDLGILIIRTYFLREVSF